MIQVIGGAFDLCGMRLGSRLGPAAIRLAGLAETLLALGFQVADLGDVTWHAGPTVEGGLRNFGPLIECLRELKDRCSGALNEGSLPLLLGGEHTLAVAAVSAALEQFGDSLGLLWIDAHADANTPGDSASGNIHGMPIAALAGLGSSATGQIDREWCELLDLLGPNRIPLDHVAWYGLRSVDQPERTRLHGLPVTIHDIDRLGVERNVQRIDEWLKVQGIKRLWISFDVDALDPVLAPGTGTAVRGGLSYREAHLTAELLRESLDARDCPYELVGLDVVETNPLFDTNNATAILAVEWVGSLLGKTILGKR